MAQMAATDPSVPHESPFNTADRPRAFRDVQRVIGYRHALDALTAALNRRDYAAAEALLPEWPELRSVRPADGRIAVTLGAISRDDAAQLAWALERGFVLPMEESALARVERGEGLASALRSTPEVLAVVLGHLGDAALDLVLRDRDASAWICWTTPFEHAMKRGRPETVVWILERDPSRLERPFHDRTMPLEYLRERLKVAPLAAAIHAWQGRRALQSALARSRTEQPAGPVA